MSFLKNRKVAGIVVILFVAIFVLTLFVVHINSGTKAHAQNFPTYGGTVYSWGEAKKPPEPPVPTDPPPNNCGEHHDCGCPICEAY